MSENSTQAIWLTQEAYDKLKMELDYLSGPGRAGVSAKIAAAREEGDLSENGGYHAAREEQAHQEAGASPTWAWLSMCVSWRIRAS